MKKPILLLSFLTCLSLMISCSRKTLSANSSVSTIEYEVDSAAVIEKKKEPPKPVAPKPPKPVYPKVITVNDAAASRSVDGRMYYDVQGQRYWKNFKDGKYYLFDKSMYNNPDFKPPAEKKQGI